ncbi:hypothetical protein AB0B44_26185, partial [Streptomyces sp. NPDC041003]
MISSKSRSRHHGPPQWKLTLHHRTRTIAALGRRHLPGPETPLTTLHELTERLARTSDLDTSLHEFLRAGASL